MRPGTTQDLVELEIARLGDQGDGVGTLDGMLLHVPWTLPGERVRARRVGRHALPVEWLVRAPDRAASQCPHFGGCGGCTLQHLAPDRYRALKRDRVVTALARAGLHDPVIGEMIATPPGRRRRAVFAARHQDDAIALGFNGRMSHQVIDMTACAILRPELMRLLPELRGLLGALAPRRATLDLTATLSETGVDLLIAGLPAPERRARESLAAFTRDHLARLSVRNDKVADVIAISRTPVLHFGGVAVEPPPGAFLQATAEGEAAIVAAVREGIGKAPRIADLFAGCGTLTFPLAADAKVHAVDGATDQTAAIESALRRASLSGRVTTERRDLERRPLLPDELKRYDAVVFDPPFAGAAAQAAQLARSGVKRIVGVSCNPATFARDAATLAAGGYRLERVTPIDQFLWSPHVEVVGVFVKR
jgi:23S rRNA (uracil1939-C5)-methyltransferase